MLACRNSLGACRQLLAGILALLWLLAPLPALALVEEMSLLDLTREARHIVVGQVRSAEVVTRPGSDELSTLYRIAVRQHLKPVPVDTNETLVVRVLGGKTAEGSQLVLDSPRYQVGERVLVFLIPHPTYPGQWHTLGWWQGKFTLSEDGSFVRERAEMPLAEFRAKIGEYLRLLKRE